MPKCAPAREPDECRGREGAGGRVREGVKLAVATMEAWVRPRGVAWRGEVVAGY